MPARSSNASRSAISLAASRAVALRDAGIRRNCPRRSSPDTMELCLSASEGSDIEFTRTPSHCSVPVSVHDGTNSATQEVAKTAGADDSLPSGCFVGTPIPIGRPVSIVPQLPVTLDLAIMRSIQADNYKFIRHMIMSGWAPSNPSACSFSITINRDDEYEVWNVSQATPLHYAVCSGSLAAAAAILIAFPELAFMACKVETSSRRMPQESLWTTLDLTSFFGNLYMSLDQERHLSYQQASLVLLNLKEDASRLPFMHLDNPKDRLRAAGKDAAAVVKALHEAVHR